MRQTYWAPSEGETLAGGGALMSANLWKAENVISAEALEDGIYTCSGSRGVRANVTLDRLSANQTFYCGFSVNPGADDHPFVSLVYKDAAGHIDYAASNKPLAPAGKWTRVSESVVVPSGMTVYQMVICNDTNASGESGWKVTNPTLSLGSPVCLASSAHTPYATQDHVAATYAPKSHKHAMADVTGLQAALDGIAEGVYPVGSLYLNATDATNPHDLLGFGTWAAFGQGRMLLSASDAHEAGATGGSETVALTAEQMPGHTHTATTSSAGAHTHTATTSSAGAHTHNTMAHKSGNEVTGLGLVESTAFVNRSMVEGNNNSPLWTSSNGAHSHSLTTASSGEHHHTLTTASAGGGKAHNNMPPYITVYMWVRTA